MIRHPNICTKTRLKMGLAVAAALACSPIALQAQQAPTDRDIAIYAGLHAAAANGEVAEIEKLITEGENPNIQDANSRTPLLVAWPGRIKAGSKSDAIVSWIDILPTCLEAAGGKPPDGLGGRSFYVLHNRDELDVDPTAAGIDVVVSGHSHRPKIETVDGVLYLNPGSAGPRRFTMPIALATDSNPGTSPITSLLMILNMAATLFRLTVDEAIAGVNREAARALGRLRRAGTLETGKHCDLAIWNIERPAELVYRMGFNPLHARVWRGA